MPDYKALYFELFRATEQAARILLEAQQRAEEQVMGEDREPVVWGGSPSQSKPDGFASSPKGGAFPGRITFRKSQKPLTLGEVASQSDDGEGKPAGGSFHIT